MQAQERQRSRRSHGGAGATAKRTMMKKTAVREPVFITASTSHLARSVKAVVERKAGRGKMWMQAAKRRSKPSRSHGRRKQE